MKRRWLLIVSAAVAAMLMGSLSYAAQNGTITGRVTDRDGNPIPGVNVTVTSDSLQGSRADVSSENGAYRLAELPPGDYDLRAELMGMKTAEQTGVKVQINRTINVNLAMEVATYEETVTVVAAAPVVDTSTSTVGVNVERDFTERLPASDQFQDAFGLAGGVNGGGNVRVHGGSQMDNLYLFDGIDTTDPVTSTFGANLNADAIQEVEIQTGGFQAEYGRSRGGIVNAITKAGGNRLEGVLRFKVSDSTFDSTDRRTTTGAADTFYFEPTASIGGPILKDRLWFFVTYRRTDIDSSGGVLVDPGQPPGQGNVRTDYDTSQLWEYPFAKLTFQPVASHKFVASWNDDKADIPASDNSATADAQSIQKQGGPFYGLEWTWIIDAQTFLNVRAGMINTFIQVIPRTENASTPSMAIDDTGTTYGNYGRWYDDDRFRYSTTASLSRFIDTGKGTHDLKGGLEYQRLEVDAQDTLPGGATLTYFEPTAAYPNGYWEANTQEYFDADGNPVSEKINYGGDYYAAYLQDNWEVFDGFTFSPGLRYEYATYQTDTGDEAGTFDMMLAPRLGAAWDVTNDGSSKVNAYVGRYYNPFDLQLPGILSTTAQTYRWRYDNTDGAYYPDYGDPSVHPPIPTSGDPNGWEQLGPPTGAVPNTVDSDLKPEYSDEANFGYERELTKGFSLGATFTGRWTRDIVEDVGIFVDPDTGETYDAFDLADDPALEERFSYPDYYHITNPEGAKRDYYGFELASKGRTGNFDWLASYTYSVTKGTVIGTQPGSAGVSHFSVYYDTPALTRNLYGELPWDCTHYVKANGSYSLPWGTVIGATIISRDGYAYSKLIKDDYYASNYAFDENGRGGYRNDWVTFIDMSLQQDIDFDRYGILTLIMDVGNVFDQQTSLGKTDQYADRRPWNFQADNAYMGPRNFTFQVKYAF